ncbi:UDP-glucose 4-epimerase family protein [Nitrincola sp. A-D6]|uniref:UDP-glucose 4-epimerase family protein n=1 Tax=Nitrincola sp. A-D6 TaxID=1545442 RepID=UPI00068D3E04|nr:SDR family oxidoreductase [Nitrincola sp. A-D6]
MNLLLTGATGFLGRQIAQALIKGHIFHVTAAVRYSTETPAKRVVEITSLDANTCWSSALTNQQVVIHTAARAHIMKDEASDPLSEYRKVNVDGTLNLALQAAEAGVKRLIFISSIGVNGNINTRPFTEKSLPNPAGVDAKSKFEAEQGLWKIQQETGMEIVIIRPPLVYGPNAKGNFGSLLKWVEKGLPLPLGIINNKRSLVALDNLVDLIITCIDHPAAANQIFLAGDGQDVSTTELLRGVAAAMGKPSRLIPVPVKLLTLGAALLGKKAVADRLLGSLQVDISKARNVLGWEPPVSVEEGLRRCFVENNSSPAERAPTEGL